jgi:hypothetical protein
MADLTKITTLVNDVFSQLGQRHADSQIADHQWVYIKGSAFCLVEVREIEVGGKTEGVIQVVSPICSLPKRKNEFMQEILSYNHKFAGPAFTLYGNMVCLKMARPFRGADKEDIEYMIKTVGAISDKLDNALITVYGAKRVDVNLSLIKEIAQTQYFKA